MAQPEITSVLTYSFPGCWVHVDEEADFARTVFCDGAMLEAVVNRKKDARTARDYGYENDVRRLWREHDLLHHWTAVQFGHRCSPTIWSVAHPDHPDALQGWEQRDEEAFVAHLHRWLNGGAWHPLLDELQRNDHDVMRAEIEAMFRGELLEFGESERSYWPHPFWKWRILAPNSSE